MASKVNIVLADDVKSEAGDHEGYRWMDSAGSRPMTATTPVLVPDCSVLLQWVLESADAEDRDRALEIRETWLSGRCAIVLPSLWFFEVGNILGLKQEDFQSHFLRCRLPRRRDKAFRNHDHPEFVHYRERLLSFTSCRWLPEKPPA